MSIHRRLANAQPGEVVHHINGDAKDNRVENLEVLPSQSVHAKRHWDEMLWKSDQVPASETKWCLTKP